MRQQSSTYFSTFNVNTDRCINLDQSGWPIHTSITLLSHGSSVLHKNKQTSVWLEDHFTILRNYCVWSFQYGTTVKSTFAIISIFGACLWVLKKSTAFCGQNSNGYWCWQYSTDSHMMLAFRRAVCWWWSAEEFRVWCQRSSCRSHCNWMMCWGCQSHCLLLHTHILKVNVRCSSVA